MAHNLTVLYWDTVNNRWHQLKQREENPGFDSNYATTPTNKPYIYSDLYEDKSIGDVMHS